ncbi:hypothetical protein YB2330_001066 [Saitoella coloradoensis]
MSVPPTSPLRPYYIPPSDYPFPDLDLSNPSSNGTTSSSSLLNTLGEEYGDYLEEPDMKELFTGLLNAGVVRYFSTMVSQPFEVAKMLMQVQHGSASVVPADAHEEKAENYDDEDETGSQTSDDSNPPYFSSSTHTPPDSSPLIPSTPLPPLPTDRTGYILTPATHPHAHHLPPQTGSLRSVISALWHLEGARGVLKGLNAQFVHSVAQDLLEAWVESALGGIAGVPDVGMVDIADAMSPVASLLTSLAACTVTALLLSPIDIAKTRLMTSSASTPPRSLLPALRQLPTTWHIPPPLLLPTLLHALLPRTISLTTPLFIRRRLGIDPILHPLSYSVLSFLGSSLELGVRLPLETILRRGQLWVAGAHATIVRRGRYAGVLGTTWIILREEDGVRGLWRGWKMGMVGLGVGYLGVLGSEDEVLEDEF